MAASHSQTGVFSSALGRSWWVVLLFGILSILFGLMAVFNPIGAGAGMTWAIGVLAIAEGVVTLLATFKKDVPMSKGWMWAYGLVSLLFGVLAVVNPVSMAASFVMVMAAWFIIAGVVRITMAIRVRKEIDNEWTLILSGLLAVVLGGLMLAVPLAGLLVAVIWIGAGALIYGVLQVYAALQIRKLLR